MWYLKDSGDSYSETRCAKDWCYFMPYIMGDDRDMQVLIPSGYDIARIWFADLEGNRYYSVTGDADAFSIIVTDDFTIVTFSLPTLGDANCPTVQTGTTPVCVFDIVSYLTFLGEAFIDLYNDYLNNTGGVTVSISYNGGAHVFLPALPTGWGNYLDSDLFTIPCPPDGATQVDIAIDFYIGGVLSTQTDIVPIEYIFNENIPVTEQLKCFRFEIPMSVGGEEVATMLSEPFSCIDTCVKTLEIESDYCLQQKDVFDELYFNFDGIDGTVTGNKDSFSNKMRVQLALKTMPSRIVKETNNRCNTYRSSVEKAFKLQAFETDLPDYMIHAIESIMAGKIFYIEDTRYELNTETIATERGLNGYNMKRLDTLLKQCEQRVVFPCKCTIDPPNCDEDPVVGGVLILPSPEITEINGGVDRSYIYAKIFPTGGVGLLTIYNWYVASLNADPVLADVPGTDIEAFDDSRDYNFFRRTDFDPCGGCLAILANVKDDRNCEYLLGLNVDMDDLRCVGYDGDFTVTNITDTDAEVTITGYPTAGVPWSYRLDLGAYVSSGELTGGSPYVVTGLTPNTEYSIMIELACVGGAFPERGYIGPIRFTTLP